jgi:hypothetical protein
MNTYRLSRIVAAGALLALAAYGTTATAKEPKDFVVHEWGTFSTFAGADGSYQKFYPNDGDLPDFMHSRHRHVKSGLPDSFVSLETPVMYFYSDRDRTASVNVEFPKGVMTDWYPEASRPPDRSLRWDNLKIRTNHLDIPDERGKGRYFAARETESQFVQASGPGWKENEKFLFYRGVGDFFMPFSVRALGNGKVVIMNTGKDAIPGLFLVRVEKDKVYFEQSGHLSPNSEVRMQVPKVASTAEKLGEEVAKLLTEQGLYEKEARAMVKTWSNDWFGQDGIRVLYLIPESLTAEFLPLQIDPKPDKLVRVLVGRHDFLTPETERKIEALVKRLHGNSNADSEAADRVLNELGRYRFAAQRAAEERLKAESSGVSRR